MTAGFDRAVRAGHVRTGSPARGRPRTGALMAANVPNPPRHRSVDRWGVPDRDPEGRAICRWCRHTIDPKGRRLTFCSQACVEEWKIRSRPSHVRWLLRRRDHEVCALCHVDTAWLRAAIRSWSPWDRSAAEKVVIKRVWRSARWQADHIRPVAEGGGDCGLDNYRTLCCACHAAETGKLRRRLNAAKRDSLDFRTGATP